MGKRSNRQKGAVISYSDDDDNFSTFSTCTSDAPQLQEYEEVYNGVDPLENHLDALYEKRGSTREKALEGLVDAFQSQLLSEFAESKCITLQNQYINSIKRGSVLEASLASRALGLLAITVGLGDNAHEILEESIPHLSQALKSGSDSLKRSSVLDCLAILTFIGANDSEETLRSMQMIWQMIHPKPSSNAGGIGKPAPSVLPAAVSAWAFLLTTLDTWRISPSEWQESIAFLSALLDKDDRAVRIAAGEAIALIYEIRNVAIKVMVDNDYTNFRDGCSPGVITQMEVLKGKFLNQVRNLSAEAGGKGITKKDLNNQRNVFRDVLEFLETGYRPEMSLTLQYCDSLVVSTWVQLIQLNFLKHFLGSGFLKHMQENELLHDIFSYSPKIKMLKGEKRMSKSMNVAASRARTQFLKKQRMLAQERNNGCYSAAGNDDT